MQRYVAFVAGLPCGRESVGMGTLRNLFTRLGFLNVEPFLTNGNVGPDAVLHQLKKVGIPITLMRPGGTVDSAQMLLTRLGEFFYCE